MSSIDVTRRVVKNNNKVIPEGIIQVVHPHIALVQPLGSTSPIPCAYDQKEGVTVGKRCTYMWVEGRKKYVIQSVYGQKNTIVSSDKNKADFELAPPANIQSSNVIPRCIYVLWDSPSQQNITCEIEYNITQSEINATVRKTRAGGIVIPTTSAIYFRVRSTTEDWKNSAWSDWYFDTPVSPVDLPASSSLGAPSINIFTQTVDVSVTNTVTQTTLAGTGVGSLDIPANTLIVGSVIRIKHMGIFSTMDSGSTSLQFEIDIGTNPANITAPLGVEIGVSDLPYEMETEITIRTDGSSGTASRYSKVSIAHAGGPGDFSQWASTAPMMIDTTIVNSVNPLITWGDADPDNIITCQQLFMQLL